MAPTFDSCSVCLCTFSITASRLVRSHGPFHSRCPGSGKPLKIVGTISLAGSQQTAEELTMPPRGLSPPPSPPKQFSLEAFQRIPVLKRIPKGARHQCLFRFCSVLSEIVAHNSVVAWKHLLHFSARCLRVPPNGRTSLATRG